MQDMPNRKRAELSQIDPVFQQAIDKGLHQESLTQGEVESLLSARDQEFAMLLMAADALRKTLVGDVVTYVVNRNINFTNICECNCGFCGFVRNSRDPDAYTLTMKQIGEKVREAKAFGATEVCVQGGVSQNTGLSYIERMLQTIRNEMPEAHIHALSPMEIDYAARLSNLPVDEVLRTLIEAGLDSMPGTAAEILVDRVRNVICPNKLTAARWEEVIITAHGLGIPTTSTMMYGTVETVADRAAHLLKLREIQENTSGFTEFVPLPFVHGVAPISNIIAGGPSGADDLRVIATARLALGPKIPNIQVSWVKMGIKLAQIGLTCGANDFGGTLMEENISKSAGATFGSIIEPDAIRRLVRDLGRMPAQRNTIYDIIG
jgi:FO synthase subunit 2